VEFEVGKDDNGKLKALNVTAPGGGPCTGPRTRRIRNNRKKAPASSDSETKSKTNKILPSEENGKPRSSTPKEPRAKIPLWHSVLEQDVKNTLRKKAIRTKTGTVDIAYEEQRIKLGRGGYAAMAHADGMLAEGTFATTEDGVISFQWDKAMVFEGGDWKTCGTNGLLATLDLTNDAVKQVGLEETPETLWGEGKTDPRDALEAN
jgi:hypothetical protein